MQVSLHFWWPVDSMTFMIQAMRTHLQKHITGESEKLISAWVPWAFLPSVTRAGITSYEGGLKLSDHQALFIDISEEILFSSQGIDPTLCHSLLALRRLRMPDQPVKIRLDKKISNTTYVACDTYSLVQNGSEDLLDSLVTVNTPK